MKTKVFISNPGEGWSEIEVPEAFHKYPYDLFVSNVHKLLHHTVYKGLLITENPMPFFATESRRAHVSSVRQEVPLHSEVIISK